MGFRTILLILVMCQLRILAQESKGITHHKRQFRAAWMATVRNLDWPSKPGLNNRKLRKEFIEQVDLLQNLGMNAVIVQIRPAGDAFYPSEYEPWSEFLSGKPGKAPSANFDPLAFMIEETHKRAMEFHAWFNPYRGIRNVAEARIATNHIYFQHPEWFVTYGKDAWFDPGMVPARKFVEKVIADVVSRYDIDAVHFDDYYYPYRLKGIEFPDSLSFSIYPRDFTVENKDHWRRDNINLLVKELHDTINHLKPWVHFGISPFGVWRNKSRDPKGSATNTSQTNYDDLYGDALTWLSNEWLDYIIPQSYEYLGRDIMDYRVVARWWNDNHGQVNYYIGQSPYRLGDPKRGGSWVEGNEIVRQLYFNDSISNLQGTAYFRSQTFIKNPLGLNDSIQNRFYRYPAIAPASHHDVSRNCEVNFTKIEYRLKKRSVTISWQVNSPVQARYFTIYKNSDHSNPENIVAVTASHKIKLRFKLMSLDPSQLYMTAVDRYRKESSPVRIVEE